MLVMAFLCNFLENKFKGIGYGLIDWGSILGRCRVFSNSQNGSGSHPTDISNNFLRD
jgi:hypothetical protein